METHFACYRIVIEWSWKPKLPNFPVLEAQFQYVNYPIQTKISYTSVPNPPIQKSVYLSARENSTWEKNSMCINLLIYIWNIKNENHNLVYQTFKDESLSLILFSFEH